MKKTFIIVLLIIIIGVAIWYVNEKEDKDSDMSLINQVTYNCDNNKTIEAAFYKGEDIPVELGEPPIPTGKVKLVLSDGRNFNLPQTISASGVRYANHDESFVFWSKGDGALVLENGMEKDYTNCIILIEEPIKIISPNGGEVWSKGQNVQILWEAKEEIEFVNIRLMISEDNEGQSFNATLASNILNTGSYEWIVQNLYSEVWGIEDLPLSDKYILLIEDSENNNINDKSDLFFSIK